MSDQVYKVRDPQGNMREVRGPAGASDSEIIAQAQKLFTAPKDYKALQTHPVIDPTEGMSIGQKIAAGGGAQLSDMWDATKQIVGAGPSSEEVKEKRALNAPLDATAAGKVGRFAGAVIPAAATAVIPGANTYTGAALTSAAMGALEPVTDDESRLKNTAVAGTTGVIAKAGMDKVASALADRLSKKTADLAAKKLRNTVADETIGRASEAGYVVPPSAVNPSWLNRRLESVAGKAAVGQEAAFRNQEVTNKLARQALGLADDVPIKESTLKQVRTEAGKAYKAVADLDPRAATALQRLKDARAESKVQWNFYNKTGTPEALRKAKGLETQIDILERVIEKSASNAGKPELVSALKEARTRIAKSYDVERALNLGTGDVSAPVVGRLFDKGKVTGDLETVGRFAEAFPAYARDAARIPTPGVSKSEAITSALLATVGSGTHGAPGLMAGGLPFLSGPARSLVLSRPYQDALVRVPNYTTSAATRALPKVAGNPAVQAGGRAALIDAILANSQQ